MAIDEKKLTRMKNKIYVLERKNAMSKVYSNADMKSKIKNIIKEEERKNYWGDIMIIKSIKFENFRPFYGIQKMDFTCEDDKNVVVVLAQNACGKTTLILSFIWCLYGKSKFENKEEYDLRKLYNLFLENNIKDNEVIVKDIKEKINNVNDESFEDKFLLITSMISISNMYRKVGELLIDECFGEEDDKKWKI